MRADQTAAREAQRQRPCKHVLLIAARLACAWSGGCGGQQHACLVEAGEAALRVRPNDQHRLGPHRLDQRSLAVGGEVGGKLQPACRQGGQPGAGTGWSEWATGSTALPLLSSGRRPAWLLPIGRTRLQLRERPALALSLPSIVSVASTLASPAPTWEEHQVGQVVARPALHRLLADGAGRRGPGALPRGRNPHLHQAAPAVEEHQAARAAGAAQRVPRPATASHGGKDRAWCVAPPMPGRHTAQSPVGCGHHLFGLWAA